MPRFLSESAIASAARQCLRPRPTYSLKLDALRSDVVAHLSAPENKSNIWHTSAGYKNDPTENHPTLTRRWSLMKVGFFCAASENPSP